jgi:WD40 repeat protein
MIIIKSHNSTRYMMWVGLDRQSECTNMDAAWFADGRRIASIGNDGNFVISDITKLKSRISSVYLRTSTHMTCAVSKSMTMVAYGGLDNHCNIHKLKDHSPMTATADIVIVQQGYVSDIKFLGDEKVVVCSGDTTATLHEIETQSLLLTMNHASDVMRSVFINTQSCIEGLLKCGYS